MLWNFEEITDSGENSLGTSSSVETDPLSSMLASIVRQSPVGGIEIRGGGGGHIRGLDFDIAAVDRSLIPHPNDQHQLMEHQHNFLTGNPASMVQRMVKCSLCQMLYKEPKVLACFHSFCKNCLERQIKIKQETTTTPNNKPQSIICQICCQETQLNPQLGIEGLLSDYGLENAVQSLGTSTPYSEQSEDLGFGSLKSSDGWPAQQVPDFLPSSNNNSCQQQSNNLNKVPSNVCMCLEHRQQPLVFFCQYCQHAICRECIRKHKDCKIDRIDNVSNKQIKMMEHLLNEAQIKQNGLNEMFQLINLRQNNLNASFQQAKQTIDDTFYFLIKTLHEAQKSLYKELEGAYSYNNNNLNLNKLGGGEYRLGVPDLQQAKQAIITPFNQLRAGGAWINNNQQQNNPSISLGTTKINCNSSNNSRNNILATSAPTNSNNGWGGNKPLVSLDCRCDRRTQDKCEC